MDGRLGQISVVSTRVLQSSWVQLCSLSSHCKYPLFWKKGLPLLRIGRRLLKWLHEVHELCLIIHPGARVQPAFESDCSDTCALSVRYL
jgi:hypothetical protein